MFKTQRRPGWMAIELQRDCIRVAHVTRSSSRRPRLALKRSFERAGSDVEDLGRIRKTLGLQGYRCITSIDESAYQIVQINAPAVTPNEMNAALRWGIKEALEFPVDGAIVDSLAIPRDGGPGRASVMLAVAARRERVVDRVQAFQFSNVPLQVIDIAETAQRNLATLFEQQDRVLAFLAFNEKSGLLTFTRNGELYAMRRIDVGIASLSDLTPDDAREPMFERIALELQRSLDNFDRLFSQLVMERVLIAPHDGAAALLRHLRDNLTVPVDIADLDSVLDCEADSGFRNDDEQARWLHTIGLALREETAA